MVWYLSDALINKIADKLEEYKAKNIVVDPVMVATSGAKLICDEAVDALKKRIASDCNRVDSEYSGGRSACLVWRSHTEEDMIKAAEKIGTDISLCSTLQRRTSVKRCQ